MKPRRKRRDGSEDASPTDTATLLIRAQDSIQRFDAQLARSQRLADDVRRELDSSEKRLRPTGTPSARARRGRSA